MLERFEKYILVLKKRIDPKIISVTMFSIFGLVVLAFMNMANVYGREKQTTTDIYNKSMYELITSVNNIDMLVAKARITSSNEYNITTMTEIVGEAIRAKDNLSSLPIDQNSTSNVSKFLSQVGGYMNSLIKSMSYGNKLTKKDHETLKEINETATLLKNKLNEIYVNLTNGKIKWNEVEHLAYENLVKEQENMDLTGIKELAKTVTDYEGLIYDGAFSNHIESVTPKLLTGKIVTKEEATVKVNECIEAMYIDVENKKEIEEIIYNGEIAGKLELYTFEVKIKDSEEKIDIQITKDDAKLALLISDRKVQNKNITTERAKKIGENYLKELGLEDLKPTYFLEVDNMITINYAAIQGEIVLYPDLIKVKIAMDTGEVCSVECSGYIYNHTRREDILTTITKEEAEDALSKDMKLEYSGLAIIPTEFNTEVLTYEFKGTIDDRNFLIYINAKTGKEENILLIIETPGGTLTM